MCDEENYYNHNMNFNFFAKKKQGNIKASYY